MSTYRIVRMYRDRSTKRTLKTGLTLEQAQEHCRNKETSSSTCTDSQHAETFGPWFDGYEEERSRRRPRSMLSKLAELQTI